MCVERGGGISSDIFVEKKMSEVIMSCCNISSQFVEGFFRGKIRGRCRCFSVSLSGRTVIFHLSV